METGRRLDANEFIKLLENPTLVERKSVEELKKLAQEYPYSQPVQLLYAMRLSQSSEYLFNRQLGKTSLLTDDRTLLFDLFEREQDGGADPFLSVRKTGAGPSEGKKPDSPGSLSQEEKGGAEPSGTTTREGEKPAEVKPAEEKITRQEEGAPEVVPEKPVSPVENPEAAPVKENIAEKFAHLPPKERVKAILEENKRLRELFEKKKSGEYVDESAEKEVRPSATRKEEKETWQEVAGPANNNAGGPVTDEVPPERGETMAESTPEDLPDSGMEHGQTEEEESSVMKAGIAKGPVEEEERVIEPLFVIDDEGEEDKTSSGEVSFGKDVWEESHTFPEWLQILKVKAAEKHRQEQAPVEETPPGPKAETDLPDKIQLLDSFIEKLPELKKKKPVLSTPSISIGDLSEDSESSLVTETLAKVYLRQKHYAKAIKAYEILRLKYPEKSGFFADQIFEIRKLIDSK